MWSTIGLCCDRQPERQFPISEIYQKSKRNVRNSASHGFALVLRQYETCCIIDRRKTVRDAIVSAKYRLKES